MKKHNLWSWFDENVYEITVIVAILPTVGFAFYVDKLYLRELDWFIRYPLNMVSFSFVFLGLLYVLRFISFFILEPNFNAIRRIMGRRRPLKEVEKEIEKEDLDKGVDWCFEKGKKYVEMPEDVQRTLLWHGQNNIANELRKEIRSLKILVYVLLALVIAIAYHLFI
jgi:hypothetical protein